MWSALVLAERDADTEQRDTDANVLGPSDALAKDNDGQRQTKHRRQKEKQRQPPDLGTLDQSVLQRGSERRADECQK